MNFKKRIIELYYIFPYLNSVENKISLIFFILIGGLSIKVKLKNEIQVQIKMKNINAFQNLIAVLKYSVISKVNSDHKISISFDQKNYFSFSLNLSSPETIKLLGLFYHGIKNGACFSSFPTHDTMKYEKLIIISNDTPKIIQTATGLRFYLESIDPLVFIETFILKIHDISFFKTLEDKIVVDVGANVGDTSLFFASQGAKVFAFEPLKTNYDAMMKNISLNPNISKKIFPINAAIGTDGVLKIHHSSTSEIDGHASLFYNPHGTENSESDVTSYSLNSALKKFEIKTIDLLKMDCKGCEFLLNDKGLSYVNNIKIEYLTFNSHRLNNLIELLSRNGFEIINYLHNPNSLMSLSDHGTLVAIKH